MIYVLLIYQPSEFNPKVIAPEEHAAIGAEYQAVSSVPNVSPGPPLGTPQQAMTVSVKGGKSVVEAGPYVSAAGAVGGFMIFEADHQEEASALAARVPAARLGGAVEVRPCEVYW